MSAVWTILTYPMSVPAWWYVWVTAVLVLGIVFGFPSRSKR